MTICRACNTEQPLLATHKFRVHTTGRSQGTRCWGSSLSRSEVDDVLRTFRSVEDTDAIRQATQVVDNGDGVILHNTMEIPGSVVAQVQVRLNPPEVLRLIDELGVIVRERGWAGQAVIFEPKESR